MNTTNGILTLRDFTTCRNRWPWFHFFLISRPPQRSTLFPYTTLFRSVFLHRRRAARRDEPGVVARVGRGGCGGGLRRGVSVRLCGEPAMGEPQPRRPLARRDAASLFSGSMALRGGGGRRVFRAGQAAPAEPSAGACRIRDRLPRISRPLRVRGAGSRRARASADADAKDAASTLMSDERVRDRR